SGTVLFSLLISGKEAEILARLSAAPSTPEDLRRLDNHGNTALHYAAAGGCAAAIIELIERHGLDPDAVNLIGWSPFLVACRLGHLAAARVLARRADTRRVTVYGADGFTLAAAGNHVRLMEFLAGLALATDCGSDGGVNRDGSGGVARDGSGGVARDGSGGVDRDGSGGVDRDGSGGMDRDGSGGVDRGGSGGVARDGSGGVDRDGSGGVDRDGSGGMDRDGSGGMDRDGSGGVDRDGSGGVDRGGSGGVDRGGSGGVDRDGSGGVDRDGSGGVARDEGYKGAKFAVEESDGGFRVARQLGAPLCPAAFRGAMGAMRYLLARGFPSDGAGDSAATWPLHAAAAGGCAEACSLLIEQAGASGSRRDINGLTPRQVARLLGHCKLARLLPAGSDGEEDSDSETETRTEASRPLQPAAAGELEDCTKQQQQLSTELRPRRKSDLLLSCCRSPPDPSPPPRPPRPPPPLEVASSKKTVRFSCVANQFADRWRDMLGNPGYAESHWIGAERLVQAAPDWREALSKVHQMLARLPQTESLSVAGSQAKLFAPSLLVRPGNGICNPLFRFTTADDDKLALLLGKFGLSAYLPTLREQEIDADAFLLLTEDDLIGMGVNDPTERERMLKAIAEIRLDSCI
ncbi:hypothetical protein BOX15_Mlig007500g4, partial [Macrostomum lignano]